MIDRGLTPDLSVWQQESSSFEETGISLHSIITALRRGRRVIFGAALGCFLLAAAIAFHLPNVYTATGSFVPPGAGGQSTAAAMMGQLASVGGLGGMLGSKSQGDLYVGILKSSTIARSLVERFDLKSYFKVKKESQAEAKLASESVFELGSKDPIVRIRVTDRSPEQARKLVEGYLQALQTTSSGLSLTESSQRRQFYEQRLAQAKNNLADAEVALKKMQEQSGLVAPAGQTAVNIQALAQIQADITQRQAELAALRQNESDENPDVLRAGQQIASLQAQANQLANGQKQGQYGRFSTAQVPEAELEYIRRFREVKYNESLFDIIARQYEAARLDEAKDAPLQILDHPMLPDTKSGPHRTLLMALGLLVGLMFGGAWVLLRSSEI